MVGSTYISDPRVRKSFYKNMIDGKFNPGSYRGSQVGGGIANMYSKKPYMIPVNRHVTTEPEKTVVVGKTISATEAVEERAKSELKDAIHDYQPPVTVNIKGSSRKNIASLQLGTNKTSSTKEKKSRASVNKGKTKTAAGKKDVTGNNKRKLAQSLQYPEDGPNIFVKKWRT